MAEFPPAPIPASEFFERFLPEAFADFPDPLKGVDALLGVRLEDEGGGEWLFRLGKAGLTVEPGSREQAAFSVVQSVDDWRGALWEERGGLIGRQALALFRPGARPAGSAASGLAVAPSTAALAQMRTLDGLIRVVVTAEEGGGDGDRDWGVGFKLGPGAIPDAPTTTVTVAAADVAAMERGEIHPVQALMAGRIRVDGDLGLVMQMQAISMQAAAGAPDGGSGTGS